MSECRFAGLTRPRIIPNRHALGCEDGGCAGCQPCERAHCRICVHAHAAGTCAECMATTREALRDIGRMCSALPTEVVHRGIQGEAMMLLGPVADPEARQHVEAAYLSGRLPEGWIEAAHGQGCPLLVNEACAGCAGGELHPLTVLGTWEMTVRDVFEHDEAGVLTVADAIDYLDRNLTALGSTDLLPFEDVARDLRRCRAHLEAVLHDGEQVETGAPCLKCRVPLVREWGKLVAADGWRCPKCREWRSEQDYRLNVADLHRTEAAYLTDHEMEIRTGVKAGTVRVWSIRGHVNRKRDSGRTVYAVADVLARVSEEAS